jgi:hypothetical protein
MFILEERHLDEAKRIALKHRKKKSCDTCYDRGWIGANDQNLLILCTKCVDMEPAMEDWKAYVSEHEDLKEHFSELFEEAPAEESELEKEKEKEHEVTSQHNFKKIPQANAKNAFVPGQKRTGLKKV